MKFEPSHRHELPVIARGMQSQFKHPEGIVVRDFAVRLASGLDNVEASSAGARDELPYSKFWIRRAIRCLGSEPLIIMLVPVNNELSSVVVEGVPEGLHFMGASRSRAGAEPGVLPDSNRAVGRAGSEVGAEPLFLI